MKHFLTYSLTAASLLTVSSLVAANAVAPSVAMTGKGEIAKAWKVKDANKKSVAKHQVGDVTNEDGFILTTLLEEDFSKFTAGSEEAPESDVVNSSEGEIADSWFNGSEGWSGFGVHQAGGCVYLTPQISTSIDVEDFYGMLASPVFDASSKVLITMKVRSAAESSLDVQIQDETDGYGMDGWQFYINEEWQEISWVPGYTGSQCHIYIFPTDTEAGVVYIDDIKIQTLEADGIPTVYEETNVTGTTFDINVGGDFIYYDLLGYVTHTASATEDYVIMDADFSTIDRDGTIEYPDFDEDYDWLYPDLNEYSDFTGWTLQFPKYITGGICLNGQWSEDGDYGAIISPSLDLSHNGGKVNLSMTSMGIAGDRFNIQLLTLENGAWVRKYSKGFDVTTDWDKLDVELTGGGANSVIQIIYGGTEVMALQNLKVSQTLEAGDVITLPLIDDGMSIYLSDDDDDDWWDEEDDDDDWLEEYRAPMKREAGDMVTYSVTVPERFADELFSYKVSGENIYYFIPDNSDSWPYSAWVSSAWTPLKYVGESGVKNVATSSNVQVSKVGGSISIVNPDKTAVSIYSLNGYKVMSTQSERATINLPAGIYIVKYDGKAVKIEN